MTATYDTRAELIRARLTARFKKSARVLAFDEWERERSREAPLTGDQMIDVISIAIDTLQGLYVHMDLKRARRGVDPVQQLTVLRERLRSDTDQNGGAPPMVPRAFHEAMLTIFKSLGDAHTAYRLPEPHKFAISFLPFLINTFRQEDGTRVFVVSHVLPEARTELAELQFGIGTELTSWNGVSIDEAITRATDFEEGSNTPNDFLLTLQFMTVRWLGASFGPETPWVVIGYRDAQGVPQEHRFDWSTLLLEQGSVILTQAVAELFGSFRTVQQRHRALHVGSGLVHAGRMALFVEHAHKDRRGQDALERLGRAFRVRFFGYFGRAEMREFTDAEPQLRRTGDEYPSLLPEYLVAREHTVGALIDESGAAETPELAALRGLRFGYIGIRAFPLSGFPRELFLYELRRLLNLLPAGGLVLDVRDNPGGSANLAEESLQLLTPDPVTPMPFRFVASPTTRTVASSPVFHEYAASIVAALQTGAQFSAGQPITSAMRANILGQHYFGPVVLIVNAATYSAAEVFAAGFMDNRIGPVVGLDETTGGGGANCWFYNEDIVANSLLRARPLPHSGNMQFAVRQCTRVGAENAGVPIEEIGVRPSPELRYALKRRDLGGVPFGLLLHAAARLKARGRGPCDLATTLTNTGTTRHVEVRSENIDRLDFFVNGRPSSVDVDAATRVTPSPELPFDRRVELEIRGYQRPNVLVARSVQVFPFRG